MYSRWRAGAQDASASGFESAYLCTQTLPARQAANTRNPACSAGAACTWGSGWLQSSFYWLGDLTFRAAEHQYVSSSLSWCVFGGASPTRRCVAVEMLFNPSIYSTRGKIWNTLASRSGLSRFGAAKTALVMSSAAARSWPRKTTDGTVSSMTMYAFRPLLAQCRRRTYAGESRRS